MSALESSWSTDFTDDDGYEYEPTPDTRDARVIDLNEARRARVIALQRKLLDIPYCPFKPNRVQSKFLLDFNREALFGGAAGGSKSWASLMAALQFVDIPGYSALLLRKSYRDLSQPGALMDVMGEWLAGAEPRYGRPPKWNDTEKTWEFTTQYGGRSTITFGYLQNANDHLQYQGARFNLVVFDELTQHREKQYRYLFSRMRRASDPALPISRVPTRMRATTNPGGPGHEWVRRRFIVPYKAWLDAGKPADALPHRTFHPAVLKDNPDLDAADYMESLAELDPVTRAQLLSGDWDIRPRGRMFDRSWFKFINPDEIPHDCSWVRFWDMASTEPDPDVDPDYTAGILLGYTPRGQWIVANMQRWRVNPADNDIRLLATAWHDTMRVPIRFEQEPGSSGKSVIHMYRKLLVGFVVGGKTPTGSKAERAKIVASPADAGNVLVVRGPWNDDFLDEIEIFPDGDHDDQVDAFSGAMEYLARVHHMGAINLGDSQVVRDNPWRPDVADPRFTADALARYMSVDERAQAREPEGVAAQVASIWSMG